MAATSGIQWTDATFNPWSGCSKVSPACASCYAETNYSVNMRGVKWGPNGNRIVKAESGWREPLKWDRDAVKAGVRRRVFCASLADVFEDWKGPMLASNREPLWHSGDGKTWWEPAKTSYRAAITMALGHRVEGAPAQGRGPHDRPADAGGGPGAEARGAARSSGVPRNGRLAGAVGDAGRGRAARDC